MSELDDQLPDSGRLAGIDYGTVRIGLAISDPSRMWITPCGTYCRANQRQDANYFCEFARREEVVGWVIGLPIHCDGKESQKSIEVRSFGAWLGRCTEKPVVYFDERFTTAQAQRMLLSAGLSTAQKKKKIDQVAAHLILTHFLESRSNQGSDADPLDDTPP